MARQLTTDPAALPGSLRWRLAGTEPVGIAERDALGTTARIAVWPQHALAAATAAVDRQLTRLDAAASRFRSDSEISRVQAGRPAGDGAVISAIVSAGLAQAIAVALAAAEWTGGLVDPTIGARLAALGYDRDFVQVRDRDEGSWPADGDLPGWRSVLLRGHTLLLPAGVMLDLGATAKGLGADWSAHAAMQTGACGGVLVSLGGDIAAAGESPHGGWPVLVADDHRQQEPGGGQCQVVRMMAGGLATSSVTVRQWRRGGRPVHHILDPRTGEPADGPWRTVSVAGATGADANAAATAAIIAGADALPWLASNQIPARLVDRAGRIVRSGSWPDEDGGVLVPPSRRWLRLPGGLGELPADRAGAGRPAVEPAGARA